MRILFLIRNHGYIRNYESTIRLLAERGHEVLLVSRGAERHIAFDSEAFLARLCAEHPGIVTLRLPRREDAWAPRAEAVRALRSYARYLGPTYRNAHKLRSRAAAHAMKHGVTRLPSTPLTARLAAGAASVFEALMPDDPTIAGEIERLAPDVVVATPLVDFHSYQVDYVKAAQSARIPTVWCVASWDNLSNKGLTPVIPDRVLVWNEPQRREAIELQNVPAERVVLTGAQLFDQWFDAKPSVTRAELCALAGLPDGPYLLYLCSSLFIAPDEVHYVRRWLTRLRNSPDPALRSCGVIIRPHPGHAAQWADVKFRRFGPVAVWPRAGAVPVEEEDKRRYFDSLYHCAAVVGVNTSGMIEAGIVGRRSFTLLAQEFAQTQRGTVHFGYLKSYGFVTAAASWAEHFAHLAGALQGEATFDAASRAKALSFVRPHGLDEPSTPRVVAAIEEAARLRPPARRGVPQRERLLRLAELALRPWLGPAPGLTDSAVS